MDSSKKQGDQHLQVRIRSVLDASGHSNESASVFCPQRQASTDLEHCRTCERVSSVVEDEAGRPTALECQRPDDAATEESENSLFETHVLSALLKVRVGEVMGRGVLCVRPAMALPSLAQLMVRRGIEAVPVVNEQAQPIGLVTKTELLKDSLLADGRTAKTVRDAMVIGILKISEDEPLDRAASLMAYENLSFLPVVNQQGAVVGILSAVDVLAFVSRREGYIIPAH